MDANPHPRDIFAANLVRLARLEELTTALRRAGIDVLYLKGAAFLDTLYEDPGARKMDDMDILVRQGDRQRVGSLLGELGLVLLEYEGRPVTRDRLHEWTFRWGGADPLLVDVHTAFCQSRRHTVDYDGLWGRSVVYRTSHRTVPTPSPEDSLLYVALHEAMHSLVVGPRSARDVDRIVTRWRPNWHSVLDIARRWRARRALWTCLRAARRAHATPVPGWVLRRLRPSPPTRALLGTLTGADGRSRFPEAGRGAQVLSQLATVDRTSDLALFWGAYLLLRAQDLVRSGRMGAAPRPRPVAR